MSALLLYQLMQCLDVEIDADDDAPTRRLMCACHPPAGLPGLLYSVPAAHCAVANSDRGGVLAVGARWSARRGTAQQAGHALRPSSGAPWSATMAPPHPPS